MSTLASIPTEQLAQAIEQRADMPDACEVLRQAAENAITHLEAAIFAASMGRKAESKGHFEDARYIVNGTNTGTPVDAGTHGGAA